MLVPFSRIFTITFFVILVPLPAYGTAISLAEITKLDSQFEKLSSQVYKSSALKLKNTKKNINNINTLYQITKNLVNDDKHINAIKYITGNQNLIKKNIDDNSIFFFMNLLIEHNEWNTASKLYKHIILEGDKSLISNIKFMFMKYYISRKEWQQTLNLLTDIYDDLTLDDSHYALIMKGVALQEQKKHREALLYYRKVPKSSKFYNYAQLNIAIVYIRQGWWSDAHIIMNNLLKVESALVDQEEFVNRLYLVMGYSFLQQEYFRESRDAFRNIHIKSKYANRALLGISLASASQGDNIGSLNVLNILQNKKTRELAVEESYLLLPYVYEKLGQFKTSAGSYSIALNYYEKRINELTNILRGLNKESLKNVTIFGNIVTINNNQINFSAHFPISFLNNLKEINYFKLNIIKSTISNKVDIVLDEYNTMLIKMIKEILNKRVSNLQNYLNQSRFGIARLYDNSKKNQTAHE